MIPEFYFKPSRDHDIEYKIRKSRFIAHLRVTRTEKEARTIIREISSDFRDASHNCWAYRLGYDPMTEYFSDAGEPSGTAGKPILTSIQKKALSDTLIVVTRYFGGIKLGVRGLIDAYGTVSSMVISDVSAIKVVPSVLFEIVLSYQHMNTILYYFAGLGIPHSHMQTVYADKVTVTVAVPLPLTGTVEDYLSSQLGAGYIVRYRHLD